MLRETELLSVIKFLFLVLGEICLLRILLYIPYFYCNPNIDLFFKIFLKNASFHLDEGNRSKCT